MKWARALNLWFKTIKFFIQTVQGTAHVILVGALYGSLTQTTSMGEVTPISHTINGSTTSTGVNDTFCTICSEIPDRPTTQIEKVAPLLVYISAGLLMAKDLILYFLKHEWLLFDEWLLFAQHAPHFYTHWAIFGCRHISVWILSATQHVSCVSNTQAPQVYLP